MANDILRLATRGWVTLSTFARIAGISYTTARKLKDTGQLEVIPVGGIYRVYDDEIVRFMKEGNRPTK